MAKVLYGYSQIFYTAGLTNDLSIIHEEVLDLTVVDTDIRNELARIQNTIDSGSSRKEFLSQGEVESG